MNKSKYRCTKIKLSLLAYNTHNFVVVLFLHRFKPLHLHNTHPTTLNCWRNIQFLCNSLSPISPMQRFRPSDIIYFPALAMRSHSWGNDYMPGLAYILQLLLIPPPPPPTTGGLSCSGDISITPLWVRKWSSTRRRVVPPHELGPSDTPLVGLCMH